MNTRQLLESDHAADYDAVYGALVEITNDIISDVNSDVEYEVRDFLHELFGLIDIDPEDMESVAKCVKVTAVIDGDSLQEFMRFLESEDPVSSVAESLRAIAERVLAEHADMERRSDDYWEVATTMTSSDDLEDLAWVANSLNERVRFSIHVDKSKLSEVLARINPDQFRDYAMDY